MTFSFTRTLVCAFQRFPPEFPTIRTLFAPYAGDADTSRQHIPDPHFAFTGHPTNVLDNHIVLGSLFHARGHNRWSSDSRNLPCWSGSHSRCHLSTNTKYRADRGRDCQCRPSHTTVNQWATHHFPLPFAL